MPNTETDHLKRDNSNNHHDSLTPTTKENDFLSRPLSPQTSSSELSDSHNRLKFYCIGHGQSSEDSEDSTDTKDPKSSKNTAVALKRTFQGVAKHAKTSESHAVNSQRSSAGDGPYASSNISLLLSSKGLTSASDYTPPSKRLRATQKISPPWKTAGIDGPASLLVNGRRKSSRLNELTSDEPPDKLALAPSPSPSPTKQCSIYTPNKVNSKPAEALALLGSSSLNANTDPAPTSLSWHRNVSPPWRGFEAEGPSAVVVNGRRHSTRTQLPPLPPSSTSRKSSSSRTQKPPSNSKGPDTSQHGLSPTTYLDVKDQLDPKIPCTKADVASRRTSSRRSSRLKAEKLTPPPSPGQQPAQSSVASHGKSAQFARLKLRVRDHPATTKQHPKHFLSNISDQCFEDWIRAENFGQGPDSQLNPQDAAAEAFKRLEIARASENGGLLTESRCTRFAWNSFKEPLEKYAHWSFLSNHAHYFALLRIREARAHKAEAARIARQVQLAVQTDSKWSFLRKAKTTQEIWQEQYDFSRMRYQQVTKDITLKWNLVRHEVNRIRITQYEKEQDMIGQKHLDEMLDRSTHLLKQQFRDASPDDASHGFDSSRRQSIDYDESVGTSEYEHQEQSLLAPDALEADENLSSSESGSDENILDDPDADLSPEALALKYQKALARTAPFSDESDSETQPDSRFGAASDTSGQAGVKQDDGESNEILTSHLADFHHEPSSVESSENEDLSAYQNVKIDEVAPELLDDSDEDSTDMSDDDDMSQADDSNNSEPESDDEDEHYTSLAAALYGSPHRDPPSRDGNEGESEDERARVEDVSAAQMDQNPRQPQDPGRNSDDVTIEGHSAVSTPRLEHDELLSTPTTSIIPTTPQLFRTAVSPLLRGILREYQHDGVDWLAKLYSGGRNGILADEMGLGKTIQTIALLAHLATHHEVWGPHLIVVPTSVMLNWELEFKKFCPAFKILTYYGDISERKRKRKGWNNDDVWNVCITSYNIILQDQQVFKRRGWHYLVLDEAHNIKNFQSQRWQTLLTFRTHSRLLLTGTPLQNNLGELWSLLYFLMPAGVDGSGFADLEKFLNSMKRPADQILDQGRQELDPVAQARVEKLHEILRPFLLRRLKSEVEKQMPKKHEHVVYCRLSKRQRQLYDEFMSRTDTKRTLASGNYMSIINCLMSLRKVCNHPDLFETRQIVTSFSMRRSAVADYEPTELLVRKRLLDFVSLDLAFNGLLPVSSEKSCKQHLLRVAHLQAADQLELMAEHESIRLDALSHDKTQADSVLQKILIEAQRNVVNELRNRARHVRRIISRTPAYGADLIQALVLPNRFDPPSPNGKQADYTHGMSFLDKCTQLSSFFPSVSDVSLRTADIVAKFSCVTPAVVASDVVRLTLTEDGVETAQIAVSLYPTIDPYHDARIRQSIAFPDKRLLQYDCGKLQALDQLLRRLQSEGHRCLIFTQMTRVLDILEQFLNIHGHRYLRLDGSTKVEQRQILTDRFNQDYRILAFILSSRSGGLGINLTGADTVIFYDLDWNPAMDKQCQDRCHRIGQTRDVGIYRFVSEYTIEANILRKSNQKRLLDDVIIQKGEFTTDMFQRVTYRDALDGMLPDAPASELDVEASAAVDKFLGNINSLGSVLETAEDREDVDAAKIAQQETTVNDDVDFNENVQAVALAGPVANASAKMNYADHANSRDAYGQIPPGDLDGYLVRFMLEDMKFEPIRLPSKSKSAKLSKKGKGR